MRRTIEELKGIFGEQVDEQTLRNKETACFALANRKVVATFLLHADTLEMFQRSLEFDVDRETKPFEVSVLAAKKGQKVLEAVGNAFQRNLKTETAFSLNLGLPAGVLLVDSVEALTAR